MKRSPMPRRAEPMRRTQIKRAAAAKPARPRDTGPSRATRAVVAGRSGGPCEITACPLPAEAQHHRLPRRAGGSSLSGLNLPSNLIAICAPHHAWVESHRADAYALGLLVRAGQDPAAVPVQLRHHKHPIRLDDEGGWTVHALTDDGATTPDNDGGL